MELSTKMQIPISHGVKIQSNLAMKHHNIAGIP